MTLSTSKAALAGLALLATSAAFNAQAETQQFAHPLLDYITPVQNGTTPATVYVANLSQAISNVNVIGDRGAGLARGAASDLEAALVQPLDRPRTITFPPDSREGEVAVMMAVPPKSAYNSAAVPVCVEQSHEILGKWIILTSGQVVADTQPVTLIEGKTPCKSWLIPQGMAWMQQQGVPVKAQVTMQQPKIGG